MARARVGFGGKAARFPAPAQSWSSSHLRGWQASRTAPRWPRKSRWPKRHGSKNSAGGLDAPVPGELFGREKFDPAQIRFARHGGFVIRIGEIFRDPRFAPFVPTINAFATLGLPTYLGASANGFDVGQIEWIAGNLHAVAKATKKGGGPAFTVHAQSVVIRLNRSADWQQVILDSIPQASLETFQDQNYVQLPPLPELDQAEPVVRCPDDKTIVVLFGSEQKDEETEEVLKRLFDDAPGGYAWIDAWHKADGGLVTLAVDNREVGWQNEENLQNVPDVAWPALRKTDFSAFGFSWNHQTDRMAIRVDSICPDQGAAKEVHAATLELLAYLRNPDFDDPEDSELEALRGAHVRLDEKLVETTTEFALPLPEVKAPAKAVAKPNAATPADLDNDAADNDAADDAD